MPPPPFFTSTQPLLPPGTEAAPEPGSRQSEMLAWVTAIGLWAGAAVLSRTMGEMPPVAAGAALFFTLAAVLISFGNWMTRGTVIRVEEDGISYKNPLRRLQLGWGQIKAIEAQRLASGWRVMVVAEDTAFSIRTAGELSLASLDRMPVGVPEGEALAATIKQRAGLAHVYSSGRGWRASPEKQQQAPI